MEVLLAGLVSYFVIFAVVFAVIESCILYSRKYVWNYVLLIPFGLVVYNVFKVHEINYTWLLLYPVIALLWMCIYWYLTMYRVSLEISNGIARDGSIRKFYDNLAYGSELRKHFTDAGVTRQVDIKHPSYAELTTNGLFFIPSIVLFFGSNLFRIVYESMVDTMEKVRKSFSDKINRRFSNEVDKQEK